MTRSPAGVGELAAGAVELEEVETVAAVVCELSRFRGFQGAEMTNFA